MQPYKLSATLAGHSSDVRAVASPTDSLILSASRDTTAISWTRPSETSSFTPAVTLRAGSRYINAVAYLPPSPDAPQGYAITGGQDTVINIFSLASNRPEPSFSLIGHTENVCTLHASPDGTIISGSWDRSAKVWQNFELLYDLKGHQQSVWAVLILQEGQYLTGSADNTIKLWYKHKNVRTYPGHTQAVRGLALVPEIGFASCSNDSEIHVWTLEGDLIYTLSGHTSFVYSLSVLPNGDIVSAGEDRTARIWRDGECVQTIVHPAISVWTVSSMPNGDIVTGCSDSVVRVFSASEERWSSAEQLQTYDAQVASQALPAQQIGDVKKSDLPGLEALAQPGNKPGEVKMVKNGEMVEAHQWDSASNNWQKIGEVVDAVGSGRKQLYEGKEYDYVFDVDVQEGMPPLKLPYNASENPYGAAQRFLERNELPLTYLDEVVKFIEKNTAGVALGGGNDFVDPYTGASRYQAQQNTVSQGTAEYMDPFTGASRYRAPPSAPAVPAPSVGDPWTGAARYVGSSLPPVQTPSIKSAKAVLPVRSALMFRQANVQAMQNKLYQFDEVLRSEISTSSLSMYSPELNLVDELFVYLSQTVSSGPPSSPSITEKHIDVLAQILERWPSSQLFPVMDLSRLTLAYCSHAFTDPDVKARFITALFCAAEWQEAWSVPLPKPRETNVLLLLRGLANAYHDGTALGPGIGTRLIIDKLGETPYTVLTKTQRVALATLLFNLSCVGLREVAEPHIRSSHLVIVLQVLQAERSDSEAAYRALVALGNVVYAAREHGTPLDASQVSSTRQTLDALPSVFTEDRIRNVSDEITALL